MVTALVIGDPHFKVNNVRETDLMVEAILEVARVRQPDMIVVLGDTLDRHEAIHVSPLTRAIKFLAQLMDIAPTYLLIGNHDLKNNRQFLSDEHPFTALKYWGPRMTVVDTTTLVTLPNPDAEPNSSPFHTFVFVPYVPNGRFMEALNQVSGWTNSNANEGPASWERATCIFAHQEFRGSQMGAIVSTDGDEWPLTYPYVVTGHIHDYQELQPNLLYTGTPMQHAFGDRHDKTISYFTFHSPIHREHERIDLGLPRKRICRINCAEVTTFVPPENFELKIIIRGAAGQIKAIRKHPNVEAWKQTGHRIVYKDVPLERMDAPEEVILSRAPSRFSVELYNTIKDTPRLDVLYTRMFGQIRPLGLTLQVIPNPHTPTTPIPYTGPTTDVGLPPHPKSHPIDHGT